MRIEKSINMSIAHNKHRHGCRTSDQVQMNRIGVEWIKFMNIDITVLDIFISAWFTNRTDCRNTMTLITTTNRMIRWKIFLVCADKAHLTFAIRKSETTRIITPITLAQASISFDHCQNNLCFITARTGVISMTISTTFVLQFITLLLGMARFLTISTNDTTTTRWWRFTIRSWCSRMTIRSAS